MQRYSISKERLIELLDTEARMQALDAGGVNGGWDWYGESLSEHYTEVTETDIDAEEFPAI